ncbi:DUF1127 domain-containing protein [Azospirillum canadense]|uniref:DUF1127 domain-containing protein n=1 Tax=Azospirillum canadense TaxID=403962 RepID=UPI0022269722|nr:DUF1127 domain-containing protein [Azospirillum canadense]MCW2239002.1 uncharacterized protein YjiS (DUF1127 family) [Azospirillum canadense]
MNDTSTATATAIAVTGTPTRRRFWKSEFERIFTLTAAAMRGLAERHRRREMAALYTMTERALKDVGLCRTDLWAIRDGHYDTTSARR